MNISDESKWKKIPVKEFEDPKNGYVCACERYWWVTDSDEILFYIISPGFYSMQCNDNIKIMKKPPEGCRIVFFEVLYLPDLYYFGSER
jgi:hypothetical protein